MESYNIFTRPVTIVLAFDWKWLNVYSYWMNVYSYWLNVYSYWMNVSSYWLNVSSYRLNVYSYWLNVSSYWMNSLLIGWMSLLIGSNVSSHWLKSLLIGWEESRSSQVQVSVIKRNIIKVNKKLSCPLTSQLRGPLYIYRDPGKSGCYDGRNVVHNFLQLK